MDEIPDYTSLALCLVSWSVLGKYCCSFYSLWWHLTNVDLDFSKAALFTGVALSFQIVFPVILAWPSVSGHILKQHLSRDAFLNLGLRSCNIKIPLRTIEVLSFVVFFEMSVASWESANLIMFQFHISSSLCLTNVLWFAPDFFLCVYLSHLNLSISLLALWSKARRRGSWHSPFACLHSLWCLSQTGQWRRVRCSLLRTKVLDSESIWSFPWWALNLDYCSL